MKKLLIALTIICITAGLVWAGFPSVRPDGISTPKLYPYSNGAVDSYYVAFPTLSSNDTMVITGDIGTTVQAYGANTDTDSTDDYTVGGTDVAVVDGGTGASDASTAATNLGLGTGDSPQLTAVNVGHATDTTVARASAGFVTVEGNAVPMVVAQGYTQTSQAGVGTSDVTGSSVTLADGWFSEGRTLQYYVAGTSTGGNGIITIHLYFEDGQVMSLATAAGAAGDWVAEFTIVAVSSTSQRITGILRAQAGAEVVADYATDNTDISAVGTVPVKLQIQSANAGDTVTSEYVVLTQFEKAD